MPSSNPTVDQYGTTQWITPSGLFHRDGDLPAIIYRNGDTEYWNNGKTHRDHGLPAIIHRDGREWFHHGRHHRENDLPAIDNYDGSQEWFIHGQRHRENGPAIILPNPNSGGVSHEWWQHGQRHRENGPAMISSKGHQSYWQHHKKHRIDGPAFITADGRKEWWINGQPITGTNLNHISQAQHPSLTDDDVLLLLNTAPTFIHPILYRIITANPSTHLSTRVRGLAQLAV